MAKMFFIALFLSSAFLYSQSRLGAPLQRYSADGVKVDSYDFEGLSNVLKQSNDTLYVVNFWATWCAPCVKELPHFEALNEKYRNAKVKVILVSLDFSRQVSRSLLPFIKKRSLKSEVIHLNDPDSDKWIPLVDKSWTGAIPATLIYNSQGRKFHERSFTYPELEKAVNEFKIKQ